MKEKTFNTVFNIAIVIAMLLAVLVSNILKFRNPEVDKVLLVIASIGACMGVVNTVLSANGYILTFLFGFIDVVIYAFVCWKNGVVGQFALHAFYFLPMQLVGFLQWRKRGASHDRQVRAKRFTKKQWMILIPAVLASLLAAFGILYGIDRAKLSSGALTEIDTLKVATDAAALVFNIFGQVLLSLAFMEQWYCWILVSVFSVTIWATTLLHGGADSSAVVMLLKYSFYCINSLNGLRIWLKLSRPEAAVTP